MYETPEVTELGSVAEFTRAQGNGPLQDAIFTHDRNGWDGDPRGGLS